LPAGLPTYHDPSQQQALADAAARRTIRQSLTETASSSKPPPARAKPPSWSPVSWQVLAKGVTTVDKIVAVTFTHKAAGELKIRLRQELDKSADRRPRRAPSANASSKL